MTQGYAGRPSGSHPPPRLANCDCSTYPSCRHGFERAGPTLGDWPAFRVPNASGKMVKVQACNEKGAAFVALNHCAFNR